MAEAKEEEGVVCVSAARECRDEVWIERTLLCWWFEEEDVEEEDVEEEDAEEVRGGV